MSFTYLEDTRSFIALYSRYRLVNIKYFKQILYKTFRSKDLIKLDRRLTNRGVKDGPQDLKRVI